MNIKRSIRFFFQRIFRGWDDSETWSLDQTIAKFIIPRLIRYQQLRIGYPAKYTEKEWNNYIELMIEGFQLASDDRNFEYDKDNQFRITQAWTLLGSKAEGLWW